MINTLKSHLLNIPGWRTDRKIVVFESDDWGSIRMASPKAYQRFLKAGYPVDQCVYNSNDALESNADVEKLGEVLLSVKDKHGNPAKFTINNVTANPNFENIKECDFNEYVYESFTETLKRYPKTDRVLDLYDKGIREKVFQPQFHGREHMNVNRWMEALRNENRLFLDAFDENMFSLPQNRNSSGRRDYLDSFGLGYRQQFESEEKIMKEGLDLFEQIWGFPSITFIAPCYTWTPEFEVSLQKNGVLGLQGTHVQRVPDPGSELTISKKYHFTGQVNRLGQYYLVRNAFFEPTEHGRKDVVENTLQQIQRAFLYKKPAIIQTHRVNYIGSILSENRDENLILLSKLLKEIKLKFPDMEFMSSDELLNEIIS